MSNLGWVKIHRKILDNPIAKKPSWAWLWIFLLLNANHEDKRFIFNNRDILVKRGELITGRKQLSKKSGVTQQSIRSALEYLKSTNQITIKPTNKFSIITILNYETYQEVTSKLTNQQPASNQQATTNKNDKNDKNITVNSNREEPQVPRNKDIDFILDTYKKYMGFYPTDKKPRQVAQNIKQITNSFIKRNAEKKVFVFEEIIEKAFKWYMDRDELKGETLEVFKRKMRILFDKTESKLKGGEQE